MSAQKVRRGLLVRSDQLGLPALLAQRAALARMARPAQLGRKGKRVSKGPPVLLVWPALPESKVRRGLLVRLALMVKQVRRVLLEMQGRQARPAILVQPEQ